MIIKKRVTQVSEKDKEYKRLGIAFQREVVGHEESLVSDGNVKYWADGIDGNILVDAKGIFNEKESPFILSSKANKWIRRVVGEQTRGEFGRVADIINNTDFDGFRIVTNNAEAVDFFTEIANEVGIHNFQVEIVCYTKDV